MKVLFLSICFFSFVMIGTSAQARFTFELPCKGNLDQCMNSLRGEFTDYCGINGIGPARARFTKKVKTDKYIIESDTCARVDNRRDCPKGLDFTFTYTYKEEKRDREYLICSLGIKNPGAVAQNCLHKSENKCKEKLMEALNSHGCNIKTVSCFERQRGEKLSLCLAYGTAKCYNNGNDGSCGANHHSVRLKEFESFCAPDESGFGGADPDSGAGVIN
jgi:hypothetical protein